MNIKRDKIGIGIVGLGWVSGQYVKSFVNNKFCNIIAICDLDLEKAKKIKIEYNLSVSKVYQDFNAMLRDSDVNVVCILTPHFLHAKQAIKSAEMGKNIIIEKPMAINWQEAKKLEKKIIKSGVKNMAAFVTRYYSLFKNIKSIIKNNLIGEIFHIDIDWMLNVDETLECFEWLKDEKKAGNILIQSGCHAIDNMCYLMDKKVAELFAISSKNRKDLNYDSTYDVVFRFENGSTGRIFCSYDTKNPYAFDVTIYGKEGSIKNDRLYAKKYFPGQVDWINIPSIKPDTENVEDHPFPELVNYYIDCIKKNINPIPSVSDVMHVYEIIEAAEKSAKENSKVIKLPLK